MAVLNAKLIAVALLAVAPITWAMADDAPAPPPPQDTWIGKGQFGFLSSHGNSDAESINGALDLLRYDGPWKNELNIIGLYGKNAGIVSAERWQISAQSNYTLTGNLFAFGGLRFDHDEFDGFVYQASITGGLGYKIFDTTSDKLTAQLGAGYRRLRPETIDKQADGAVISRTPEDAHGEAIGTVGVDYLHAFNKTTVFTNKFLIEAGASDTLIHDDLALTVKITDKLALSVGYGFIDNTKPPAPLKKIDTVATINLVFSF